MSGIREFINKLYRLEEAVDIILLTMRSDDDWTYVDKLSALKSDASHRQTRREVDGKLHQEYQSLKNRLNELETDYPYLKNE